MLYDSISNQSNDIIVKLGAFRQSDMSAHIQEAEAIMH